MLDSTRSACRRHPAADLDKERARLEKKREAGAELIMTQPIFQTE
jgi:5,10-methylenetetrahydrofolate reductase